MQMHDGIGVHEEEPVWVKGRADSVRAVHHCCQPLMRRLGVAATARASFYVYNDERDIDSLVHSLDRVKEIFRGIVT